MARGILDVPEQWQLVEFFESEPTQAIPRDGYWCYERNDTREVKLRFSFDIFERSIQTVVSLADHVLVEVLHEGALKLAIVQQKDKSVLIGHFENGASRRELVVSLQPEIAVNWSTLRK